MAITGFIAASWAGWPAAFYLFSGLGYGWMIVWGIFGAETPSKCSRISEIEKKYIEESLSVKKDEKVYNNSVSELVVITSIESVLLF